MNNFNEIKDLILSVVEELKKEIESTCEEDSFIPVGISNRHIHLSKEDLNTLFGEGYELTSIKDLSQPGQYAAKEVLTICGPKGAIEGVRILGPVRGRTQVEVLQGDCFKLGIKAPVSMSGELDGSAPITLIGPKGSIYLKEAVIIAQRHIHMTPEDAKKFSVSDGEIVEIEISGKRCGTLGNVVIRVTETSRLDCHLDMEEANTVGLVNGSKVKIKKIMDKEK